MEQKTAYQNKRQQNRQEQRSDRTENLPDNAGGVFADRAPVSELLAAAEAFTHGMAGRKTVEAASFFGNQVMLAMAEQSAAQQNALKSAADVLDGERCCGFSEGMPVNEITPEAAFSPVSVPAFSPEAPLTDIQQVGAMA